MYDPAVQRLGKNNLWTKYETQFKQREVVVEINLNFVTNSISFSLLQTVTHLKLALHLFVGIIFGLYFADAGWDGSKTISNFGFMMCSCVYLAYTAMMPAVLRCECYIWVVTWFEKSYC